MSTKYPGGFISSIEPTVSPLSAKGIWTLAEALRYKAAGEWPISPTYAAVQGVFATANVGQAESVIPVLLTGLQATGSVNDLTVIGSAIVALNTVSGTGGVGEVSISLPVVFDEYFNLNSLLLADSLANTFITDEGPNKFVITPNGDTRPSAFSPYNTNWSNYFENSQLSIAANSALNFGTGDFTIEGWFSTTKAEEGSNPLNITVYIGTVNGASALGLGVSASTIRVRVSSNILNITSLSLSSWTHIAFVRSSGVLYVYVNGSLGGSVNLATNLSSTGGITIARQSTSYSFYGGISNLRIVKGTAVYTAAFTPSTTPLTDISGTSLLTCQSNRFVDNSSSPLTLTPGGIPKVTSFGPFTETDTSTGSGYFDGTGDDLLETPASGQFAPTGDFTIGLWFYPNSALTINQNIVGNLTGNFATDWLIQLVSGTFNVYTNGTTARITSSTAIIPFQWNYITVTRSSNVISAHVNGTLIGTYSQSGTFGTAPKKIQIGNVTNEINGFVSNLILIDGSSNTSIPTTPLTAVSGTQLLTLQHRVSYNNSQPIDTSGIKNVITRNGNASVGAYSPFVPSGWSGYFDGSGDYLTVADNTALDLNSSDFTIEMWVYSTAFANPQILLAKTATAANYGSYELRLANGTVVMFLSSTGTTWNIAAGVGTGIIALQSWNHVALTRSGSTFTLYVNGVASGTATSASALVNNSSSLGIGAYPNNQYPITGYLSNLRIVKGTAVYTSNFTPPTSPLTPIANTSLLTLRGPSFTDDSPNRFAITRNGDTKITPSSPFAPNTITPDSYSVYFDGSGDYLITNHSSSNSIAGDFTFESWANYPSDTPAFGTIFGWRSGAAVGFSGFILQRNNSNNLILTVNSGGITITQTSATYTPNIWHHVAVTRSGSTVTLWVDGVSVGTATLSATITPGTQFGIGVDPFNLISTVYFKGYISNARFVNGTAVYTSNFTPPTSPLTAIANTSLLVCQSPTFVDNSPNDFAGSVFGNTQPSKFNPFGETVATNVEYTPADHGGSVYFDGSGDYLVQPVNESYGYGTGDFTIEFWLCLNSVALQTIVSHLTSATSLNPHLYLLATDDRIYYFTSNANRITGPVLTTGVWYHIALCRASGSTRLFVDGTQQGSTYADTNNYGATAPLGIGTYWSAGSPVTANTLNGYISGLRVLKGTALYTAAFVPPQAPVAPTPATTLLTCGNNAAIYDYTGKNVLETAGNARTVQETPYRDNHSVYFDGSGDSLSSTTTFEPSTSTSTFTIEGWVYPTTFSQLINIIGGMVVLSGDTKSIAAEVNTSGRVALYWFDGAIKRCTGNSVMQLNAWNYFAIVVTSNAIAIYVNKAVADTLSGTTTLTNRTQLATLGIGAYYNNNSPQQYFTGYLSNLRYSTIARTISVPTEPLTTDANVRWLTCNTYNFTDSSTNNFTITRNGDARISSRGPFQQNEGDRSLYFDGTGDYLVLPTTQDLQMGTGNFTWEAWVYPLSLPSSGNFKTLWAQRATEAGFGGPAVVIDSDGDLLLFIANTAATSWAIAGHDTGLNVSLNAWQHIALVRNGTSFTLYKDGVAGTPSTSSNAVGTSGRTTIAAGSADGSQTVDCLIDDLRITKGVARYPVADTPTEPLPKV